MERVFIDRDCSLAYVVITLHNIYHSANKERTIEDIVEEVKTLFDVYKDENILIERMKQVLEKEGKLKVIVDTGTEKIGMTIDECAEYLGVSAKLVAELVKLPDFPCVKFKRRILINKLGINDWMAKNVGKFIKY